MPTSRRIRRTAVLGTLACALLGSGASGATAQVDREARVAAAHNQAFYYASFAAQDSHPQAEYYTSYGDPEPLSRQSPEESGGTPWLVLALGSTAALGTVSVAAVHRRRLRVRRRIASRT